jgi:hypothetical protein
MKISERVENILRASHAARNSDTELLIIYMQKSGLELTPKQIEKFKDLPSMETITRVRRQLQEQGKYEADEVVKEARYEKFKQAREEHSDPYAYLNKLGYRISDED